MTSDTRFWDNIAEKYSRQPVPDEAIYQTKLAKTREYLRPDMDVLEFGCGTGSTAIAHAPLVRHIVATDISEKMLEIARAKAEAAGVSNVNFECASVDDLNAPDASYDAIMGHSILHLLADRDAALAKVFRMLKPGGVFISSTACIGDMGLLRFIGLVAPIGRFFGLLPLVRVFTVNDLVRSIEGAGFSIEHNWQPAKGKAVFIVARKP